MVRLVPPTGTKESGLLSRLELPTGTKEGSLVPVGGSNQDKSPLHSPCARLAVGPGIKVSIGTGSNDDWDKCEDEKHVR